MQKTTFGEAAKFFSRPERIVWAVAEYDGRRSICPLGWKMNASGSPPMMAIGVAPARYTHDLIVKSGAFVLAWPGEDLAEATLLCGTKSGRDIDKFSETGLTAVKASEINAPLVAECIANLECRLVGQMTTGDHTIFGGQIVAAWVHTSPKRLLCSIDTSDGYDFILQKGGYRFGAVKQ